MKKALAVSPMYMKQHLQELIEIIEPLEATNCNTLPDSYTSQNRFIKK